MFTFLLKIGGPSLAGLAIERFLLRSYLKFLYSASSRLPPLPRGYGAVIAINVIFSGFALISLGIKVTAARAEFKAKAIKDGDADAEERYSYPKMYAEGFSKNAKAFNCIQRSHQQGLETYPQFLAFSLLGGLHYPLFVSCTGLVTVYARLKWAEGYRKGEPSKRYDHWCSYFIWIGLVSTAYAAGATAIELLLE
eukprot:gene11219-23449_t